MRVVEGVVSSGVSLPVRKMSRRQAVFLVEIFPVLAAASPWRSVVFRPRARAVAGVDAAGDGGLVIFELIDAGQALQRENNEHAERDQSGAGGRSKANQNTPP